MCSNITKGSILAQKVPQKSATFTGTGGHNLSFFSYAGLHCVVIKGYSKSAGYQPGVKFEDNRFRYENSNGFFLY